MDFICSCFESGVPSVNLALPLTDLTLGKLVTKPQLADL